jgi:8-oxo-dGTP pyrophosphatase MutT (NUDIX family)
MAATLIVLRDGARGLEVLMLRRAEKPNDQNSGASVFPGGVLDANDRNLHAHCFGLDDARASARLAVASGGLDFYAAAVRECFEESGLLFACDIEGRPAALDAMDPADQDALREAATQSTDALLAACEHRGWKLAVDRLAYFGHWLTPPGMPRRFDTRFFVALAPAMQSVKPDGSETVDHQWLRPAEALDPARELKLMNVTRRILEQLSTFEAANACMAYARALGHVPLNMPRIAHGPEGRRAINIEEPAYDEIGYLDPDGKGDARYALEPGRVTRLSARVWRLAGDDGHTYLVGGERNEWALIDPPTDERRLALLGAAAIGPIRWTLSTKEAANTVLRPGEELDLGGARLRALPGASFLLVEEGMLFSGDHDPRPLADHAAQAAFQWIAASGGFLRSYSSAEAGPKNS